MRTGPSHTAKSETCVPAGQSENVVPFLGPAGVVRKYLPDPYPRVAVVDVNLHLHLGERQNGGIGRFLVAGNQHAAVGKRSRRNRKQPAPRSRASNLRTPLIALFFRCQQSYRHPR